MEELTGQFLVSTPHMPDPRFQEKVIYLAAHNADGAMGLAVNEPHPQMTLHEVLLSANLPLPTGKPGPVYLGGPVEQEAGFLLFEGAVSGRYAMETQPGLFMSRDARLLEDIAQNRAPEHYLFLLGYAGWGPGQLERELLDNGWLLVPADPDIIFRTPAEQRWKKAAGSCGIDINLLGDIVGNA